MPSGQLMTMPALIVNMGGEMVYILLQRLTAQKIPDTKATKVLSDVVRTMYFPRFIEELFKPQDMYSIQSTRQIFDRLAHSSIMRLNESSMDKLFDLMAMGFKFQIISCAAPQELIDVTLNHLESLKSLVESGADSQSLCELLDDCIRQVQQAYCSLAISELCAMRQSLCTFFQDRKVKVSLFLHDGTQTSDGTFIVPASGVLQPGALPPGTVRYFTNGVETRREQLPCVHAGAWVPGRGLRTQLGTNIYDRDRAQAAAQEQPAATAAAVATPAVLKPVAASAAPAAPSPSDAAKRAAAVGELNLLASLIGAQPAAPSDTFKLESLFGADIFAKDTSGGGKPVEVIHIDGTAPSEHRQGLDSIRQQLDNVTGGGDNAGPDDLLDLMDKA